MENNLYNYSFIIPHHNTPNLLNRCLDSIPQRDDIQIIVVDDNSKAENMPQISRSDVEIVYIGAEQSKGAGRARNKGIEISRGRWLLFPDCDDYYVDGFISTLDSYLNNDFDVLYFNSAYIDGRTGEFLPDLSFKRYFDNYDGSAIMQDQIKYHHNVPWTKMVRSDIVRKHNILFEEVPNGNDILFSMLVGYKANNILVEKSVLYYYLKNEGSILNTKHRTAESNLCIIRHQLQLNAFYEIIGHNDWKYPVYRSILNHINTYGITQIIAICKILSSYKDLCNDWISKII